MHENLDSVLNVFDVEVLSGYGWLQVRLQGVSKKNMVKVSPRHARRCSAASKLQLPRSVWDTADVGE